MLKVMNDICEATDAGRSTLLVALDISAAFDTIDHATLLQRLNGTFGVSGDVLKWLASYLEQRSSFVKYGAGRSVTIPCDIGVPQGSSLGPMLFTLFVAPLANVTSANGIRHHQYADDSQVYIIAAKH